MGTSDFLSVENLAKLYPGSSRGEPLVVFEDVNFTIRRGEVVCVVGHSGCGKSTILNIIAGLDQASRGHVLMRGKEVTAPSLARGVIFQNHSLLPWKTALANVEFFVRARWKDWSPDQVRQHSEKFIDMVGLSAARDRRPTQLSGGMKQRVGIARAFAIAPELLLMDEPFGALDALTRGTMQDELIAMCERTGQTTFMITHDVDEAIYLADRVMLMSTGPKARIAETLRVDLPRPRDRRALIRQPIYYELRNRLIDFLTQHARPSDPGIRAAATEDATIDRELTAPGLALQSSGSEP